MRDRIKDIIEEHGPGKYRADMSGLPDAIIAALPSMVAPLVWEDFKNGDAKARAWRKANYLITKWSDGNFELVESYPGYQGSHIAESRYSTIELAKAAANAHHVAQIMAAFATPPESTP